jgi:ribosomal protein L21E
MTKRFNTGDRVRIDIPDETDPDHDRLHGCRGTVVNIISDDAGAVTDDEREGYLFRVDRLPVRH